MYAKEDAWGLDAPVTAVPSKRTSWRPCHRSVDKDRHERHRQSSDNSYNWITSITGDNCNCRISLKTNISVMAAVSCDAKVSMTVDLFLKFLPLHRHESTKIVYVKIISFCSTAIICVKAKISIYVWNFKIKIYSILLLYSQSC